MTNKNPWSIQMKPFSTWEGILKFNFEKYELLKFQPKPVIWIPPIGGMRFILISALWKLRESIFLSAFSSDFLGLPDFFTHKDQPSQNPRGTNVSQGIQKTQTQEVQHSNSMGSFLGGGLKHFVPRTPNDPCFDWTSGQGQLASRYLYRFSGEMIQFDSFFV